jgi:hypothetical protein
MANRKGNADGNLEANPKKNVRLSWGLGLDKITMSEL